jgi:protein O-GlcNAc transferase
MKMKSNRLISATYVNKGATFYTEGRYKKAVSFFVKAAEHDQESFQAFFNLGLTYEKLNEKDLALKCYERVLLIDPHDFEALNNAGNIYLKDGDYEKAEVYLNKAVDVNPKFTEGLYNLAVCNQLQNKDTEAVRIYKKLAIISPRNEKVYNNLGISYQKLGENDKAIKYYQKALEINPNLTLTYTNLGVQYQYNDPVLGEKYFRSALKINPNNFEANYDLAVTLQNQNKIEESIVYYKKAIKLNPDFQPTYGQLYHKYRMVADWKEVKRLTPLIKKLSDIAVKEGRIPTETPFISIGQFADPARNLKIAKAWADYDKHLAEKYNVKFLQRKPVDNKRKKIRIGYVSCDFRDHATAHLMLGQFRLHDKKNFEIYVYSYSWNDNSYYRKQIKKYSDKFVDVINLSDVKTAQLINKDKIDILIDLKGHTTGCRLGIFALRSAPIQITWLGSAGSTGADYFDYMIADKIVAPKSESKYYSEKLIYLPDTYQVNDDTQPISQKEYSKEELGLPPKGIIFSSFNQTYKIQPDVWTSWMRILKRVPGSSLLLWKNCLTTEKNLKREARLKGVSPQRLVFSGFLPKNLHLKRLALTDIALDTFTYNGHTTTSDALWSGVPVVALKGKHFASRVSSSLLKAIGLPELITNTSKEYENLAVALAKDPDKLKTLKEKLKVNHDKYPLFNTALFTKNLEKAYKGIWKDYLSGKKPRMIEIE